MNTDKQIEENKTYKWTMPGSKEYLPTNDRIVEVKLRCGYALEDYSILGKYVKGEWLVCGDEEMPFFMHVAMWRDNYGIDQNGEYNFV